MVTQKTVAILLVLFNSSKHLGPLLASLKNQIFKNFRIYAIDNSEDETSSAIISKEFPDSILLPSMSNIGFAKANNILAEKAIEMGFDYLLILNPDMELTENTISEFHHLLENNLHAAACSGVLLFGNEKRDLNLIQLFGQKINFKNQHKEFLFAQKKLSDIRLPETLSVDFVNGGSLFIRSKIVVQTGLFNENYFMYNDEIDIAYRIRKLNCPVLVTSKTKLYHHHDWTDKNKSGYYLMYYYMMRNRMLFFKFHKLYLSLIFDLLKQILSLPVTVNWLIKLAGLKLVKYYYLGLLKGMMGEKGKAELEFQ